MISNDLIPLINLLKEEIKNYYSLSKRYFDEKFFQQRDIMEEEINESLNKIYLINIHIKSNIEIYKKLTAIKSEISKEIQININSEKKLKRINEFIEKGKKILINNIPYYEKSSGYTNKKLKTAKLSPLDIINLTLRLNQQGKAPPGGYEYLNSFISSALTSSRQNDVNIYSFYKKNKNRFLNILPSIFSGEEYNDHCQPHLDSNCIFKVCTCKKGFKDSKIVTFKFFINEDVKEKPIIKIAGTKPGKNDIIKIFESIKTPVIAFNPVSPGQLSSPSPSYTNGPGTSKYKPLHFNLEESGGNKDDEKESDDEK